MSETAEFKPGLEGVVAVETEIAEPDREGGILRYRGVDIEDLVGHYPYENVWGLLVDDDLELGHAGSRAVRPARLTGDAPADLQAETARLGGEWKLGKLNEISDEQAREDLGRLSAQMMGIVARSARMADGETDDVPATSSQQGDDRRGEVPAAVARRSRPESGQGDRHVLDLHGGARPQRVDLHRARRRFDRRRLRGRAVLGGRRALGPAAWRRARLREADARRGHGAGRSREVGEGDRSTRASGSWASGTASTAPRIRARASSSARRASSARRRSRSRSSSRRSRSRSSSGGIRSAR